MHSKIFVHVAGQSVVRISPPKASGSSATQIVGVYLLFRRLSGVLLCVRYSSDPGQTRAPTQLPIFQPLMRQ